MSKAYSLTTLLTHSKRLIQSALSVGLLTLSTITYSIDLVEAGTDAVGLMSGQLDVGSGAAHYSLPIAVPTSVAGLSPQISLNYNSASGNGVLGLGGSISGYCLLVVVLNPLLKMVTLPPRNTLPPMLFVSVVNVW